MATEVTRILGKLKFIKEHLQELENLEIASFAEYLSNRVPRDLSQLYLQLIFQAAIDINQHILTEDFGLNLKNCTYSNTFIQMGIYGLIDSDLSNSLSESAKMRNVLVHLYDKIDYSQLFRAIPKTLIDYSIYIEQITNYLKTLEDKDNG